MLGVGPGCQEGMMLGVRWAWCWGFVTGCPKCRGSGGHDAGDQIGMVLRVGAEGQEGMVLRVGAGG